MTDVEAQTGIEAQGSKPRIILMPRRKMKKLVQMLAYSAEILRSTLELDDQAESDEHRRRSSPLAMKRTLDSADDLSKQGEAVGDQQGQKWQERRARTTVASEEEVSRRKAANLKAFEGQWSLRINIAKAILILLQNFVRRKLLVDT